MVGCTAETSLIVKHYWSYLVMSAGGTQHTNMFISPPKKMYISANKYTPYFQSVSNEMAQAWIGVSGPKNGRRKTPRNVPTQISNKKKIPTFVQGPLQAAQWKMDEGAKGDSRARGQTAQRGQRCRNPCAGTLFTCCSEYCSGLLWTVQSWTWSNKRICRSDQLWLLRWPQLWVRSHLSSSAALPSCGHGRSSRSAWSNVSNFC